MLERTYRVEMASVLRLEDHGKAPATILHDKDSMSADARRHYNDWDYFLHEVRPQPPLEWLRCLRWLKGGTVDLLARVETLRGTLDDAILYEALVERAFSAGLIRCTLSKLGEDAAWLISGLQVRISEDFVPSGPLATWHNTEPFGHVPPAQPPDAKVSE